MKEIIVRTQAELDAIPENCDAQIVIDSSDEIVVKKRYVHALILGGDSRAELYGYSYAELRDNSRAWLYGNSDATLHDTSIAWLCGKSSAALHDNSSAVLWDTSGAALWDDSSAALLDNSQAIDNSLSHNITINDNAKIINNPDK